jgi:hypothetical protein
LSDEIQGQGFRKAALSEEIAGSDQRSWSETARTSKSVDAGDDRWTVWSGMVDGKLNVRCFC